MPPTEEEVKSLLECLGHLNLVGLFSYFIISLLSIMIELVINEVIGILLRSVGIFLQTARQAGKSTSIRNKEHRTHHNTTFYKKQ